MILRFIFLAFLPFALSATEFAPWFGRSGEVELRGTALFQFYHRIATPILPNARRSFDQFYTLSGASAFATMSAEAEVTFANTRHRSFGFDNVRLTGRYLLMDDIIGDWFSLAAGFTFIGASHQALEDLSSFHHGTLELESHVSFGREVPCLNLWGTRWWGVFAFGIANEGKPWMRCNCTWEKNFYDRQQIQLFLHALWGLGSRNIDLCEHFPGYGPYKHRSIDLGMRYTNYLDCLGGSFVMEYVHRLYAFNFPKSANIVMFRLYYPFGL